MTGVTLVTWLGWRWQPQGKGKNLCGAARSRQVVRTRVAVLGWVELVRSGRGGAEDWTMMWGMLWGRVGSMDVVLQAA